MRRLLLMVVGLMVLAGVSMAYTSQTTFETGTVSASAVTVITPDKVATDVVCFNDSGTSGENIYFNAEGDLTIARISNEAIVVKPGEFWALNNFRTKRVHLSSATGTPTYRILFTTN